MQILVISQLFNALNECLMVVVNVKGSIKLTVVLSIQLYTRYPIVARALDLAAAPLGRVRARAKVYCIQSIQ